MLIIGIYYIYYENAVKSEKRQMVAMKTEIESLNETETWDLVPKKDKTLLLADKCTKSNMIETKTSMSLKLVM